ncbi:MAG: hypothetical protein QW707_09175 [Candidatus Bathyarchaeia archaeon]
MGKVWKSYRDVDEVISAIQKILEVKGELPNPLVNSIRKTLETSKKGLVQYFYIQTADKCPEALKYF